MTGGPLSRRNGLDVSGLGSAADRADVVVVGAGIVGLSAALAAVDAGAEVIVVDRSAEAQGASIRNFGHLAATPQAGLAARLANRSSEIWQRLEQDAGLWLRRSGTHVVARQTDEMRVLEDFAQARAAAGAPDDVRLFDAAEFLQRVPVAAAGVLGGAWLPRDLQTNPRQATAAITAYLQRRGVQFRLRTAVTGLRSGFVDTSRGVIAADLTVVAVNHDIDQLLPEVAERAEVRRCALDMLRVRAHLPRPLDAPLLTGWSLLRYAGFAASPAIPAVRERLHHEHPGLASLDVNLMVTQLPDGSLILGDTHSRGDAVPPFQPEHAFDELLRAGRDLFGTPIDVLERWQGVYATAPEELLIDEPTPGVRVVAATTGIGMTTGPALGELAVAQHLGPTFSPAPPALVRAAPAPLQKGSS
ncbi:TIGR03364 family FAD-dependent oxidoreductase [Plantibacter flavus]|uniref:TIGR03364 family FAD-dependent oxidoreductase n=1 Tax=Plantibacter flavus TaxID=150123 RepID=UPI003F16C013